MKSRFSNPSALVGPPPLLVFFTNKHSKHKTPRWSPTIVGEQDKQQPGLNPPPLLVFFTNKLSSTKRLAGPPPLLVNKTINSPSPLLVFFTNKLSARNASLVPHHCW